MENLFLDAIIREFVRYLPNKTLTKLQLHNGDLVFDFKLGPHRLLIASPKPATCAFYFGAQPASLNDAEAAVTHPFLMLARKHVANGRLIKLRKDPLDRLIFMRFEKYDAAGDRVQAGIVLALTGRSANAYLLDDQDRVITRLADRGNFNAGDTITINDEAAAKPFFEPVSPEATLEEILATRFGAGSPLDPLSKKEFLYRAETQSPAEAFNSLVKEICEDDKPLVYARYPLESFGERPVNLKTDLVLSSFNLHHAAGLKRHDIDSLSVAAEQYYAARARALAYDSLRSSTARWIKEEIKKREQILQAVAGDRRKHEEPERMKRYGDLLLANLATLERKDGHARVVDYFDPNLPEILIPVDESETIQQAAAGYFARYQKARRAIEAIAAREAQLRPQVEELSTLLARIEDEPSKTEILETREAAANIIGRKPADEIAKSKKQADGPRKVGRRFLSSDGYEILVGRNDRENDEITFRIAASSDLWMHAADYPGSHVVVRNPKRSEVPHRTLREAAQIAAFYSKAAGLDKVSIHYTQRKFISRPPGGKPGAARLSSFKTIVVEPKAELERL